MTSSNYLSPDVAALMRDRMRGDARRPRDRHPRLKRSKRERVFARDGYRCRACGTTENLTIDHIIPYSISRHSRVENLQTLCLDCNRAKADRMETP